MPPLVTITACAAQLELDRSRRGWWAARGRRRPGARVWPWTPTTVPASMTSPSTRCRKRSVIRPAATCSRTRRSNGATTPGPVPHVRWNRGTELPWPVGPAVAALGPADDREEARAPSRAARSASRRPRSRRTPRPSARGQRSSSRSNWALPIQSCSASSWESLIPIRRCSGLSTRKSPPRLQNAWPPRLCSPSWSSSSTVRPASATSAAATSPARPAPTTITSASTGGSLGVVLVVLVGQPHRRPADLQPQRRRPALAAPPTPPAGPARSGPATGSRCGTPRCPRPKVE